ncbi:beta-1,6-N-acetylglucosaminyltransferase [Thiorhodovibrio frisius]|uniref:Peptide O-xylosyltransferase n=1 Tax=Thiorhodovibrio frisius TaxID=631362 RepID=H8Z1V9_9GAMM|nr:beta-1,6-N-acetylglucosaminyltransferase [Thiorhodovibrio frisius]EIC22587.1 putative N-acetylglucosaminyltransferase [Thiorhodovibrio frisius]WPL20028.1 Core-2/I-Branching enzyme [Thiorhodovibrio frisius]
MKLAFVLLAHEPPAQLRPLIDSLLAAGSDVFVHYDASAPHDLNANSREWALERHPGRLFHAKRVKVTWGEWSIVQATLNCLTLARQQGFDCDAMMLLSGSCMPIKPVALLAEHLAEQPLDYIESVDATKVHWVAGGFQEERWVHYHLFNWRTHQWWFDQSIAWQRTLKIRRRLPLGHIPRLGSQWWCLRTATIERLLALLDRHPKLVKFYRRTWVPDELFFQTLVGNLVPAGERSAEILTGYAFNSRGVPRVYYDDDLAELCSEPAYFARKMAPRAEALRQRLQQIATATPEAYRAFLADEDGQLAANLRQRLSLHSITTQQRWFALLSTQENPYDYIKSIPNPMLVIAAADRALGRTLVEPFMNRPDMAVYGYLLDRQALDFGPQHSAVAGYHADSVALAHHHWHLYLGEIAFQAPGKTLVFLVDADETMFEHIKMLRWKKNLTLLLIEQSPSHIDAPAAFPALARHYRQTQQSRCLQAELDTLLTDHFCQILRLRNPGSEQIREALDIVLRTVPCASDADVTASPPALLWQ